MDDAHVVALKDRFGLALRESLASALEDMFFIDELCPCDSSGDSDLTAAGGPEVSAGGDIVARVEFSGSPSGALNLRTDATTAQTLAMNFLGEEEGAIDNCQRAAVFAELANMVCGGVLTRTEPDCIFRLSTPAVAAATPAPPSGGDAFIEYAVTVDAGKVAARLSITEAL